MPRAAMQTRPSPSSLTSRFALEVSAGLAKPGQKELPSKYLYDSVGSALFEVICALPEYGLTRAEERLLQLHAREIVDQLPRPVVVAELGSGTGRKTRLLLEALSRWQSTWYHPIEISPTALAVLRRELRDINSISIVGFEREYLDGLREVAARRTSTEHLLVLFLGSTIGNFDGAAGSDFLRDLRQILQPGDSLLLGIDMLKPEKTLISAYDDPIGVTAAFNLNLLARINRELDGDFDLASFSHKAFYNSVRQRIEMHLVSKQRQKVKVGGRVIEFRAGETIHTENSYKYTLETFGALARGSGWTPMSVWTDAGGNFSIHALVNEG